MLSRIFVLVLPSVMVGVVEYEHLRHLEFWITSRKSYQIYKIPGRPPASMVFENLNVNADYEVDDVAFGTGPSTGPQHHDTRMDAMNMLRDMMADDMWDRFQSASWYRTT
ncbi:hypothetical protein TIFTF001_001009 [Ficus carica]|uniref:Uncharacterized protein n=1 Tax=Ficus carica TaxID=3494 RepID=A0AA88D3B4_FICCA|nr:hypothetical protein TIFTF001_001009 [Ficus carica]